MPKFDFEPDLYINSATGKLDYTYRPYLFLTLIHNKKRSMNLIKALVDSGSDHNIFPGEFATEIGLSYTKGIKHHTTAVNEYSFVVYGNKVKIDYGEKILETVIYFGENIKLPILGRNGFFNYFKKVIFNFPEKTFELIR